jgi:hypothetical protein
MTFPLAQRCAFALAAFGLAACMACGGSSSKSTPTPPAANTTATAGTGSGVSASATTTTTTATPPKSPAAAPTAANQVPAIQVVLDYYRAIDDQDYATAYHLWASNGGASNQTSDAFAKGFANTVRVDANLGQPATEATGVTVPLTVLSIVNQGQNPQATQLFAGTYHLQLEGSDWRIKSADMAEKPGPTEAAADVKDALSALNAYYGALDSGEFAKAFTYWSDEGSATGQSFADFVKGFDKTESTTAQFGQPQLQAAAGSAYATVPVVIISKQQDGTQKAFCGTYALRRLDAPPFDVLGWSIDKADVSAASGSVPGADAVQHMLANSCKA